MIKFREDLDNILQLINIRKKFINIRHELSVEKMIENIDKINDFNGSKVMLRKFNNGSFSLTVIRFGMYIKILNIILFPMLTGKIENNKYIVYRIFPGLAIMIQTLMLIFWIFFSLVVVPILNVLFIFYSDVEFNFIPLTIMFLFGSFIVFKIMSLVGRSFKLEKEILSKYLFYLLDIDVDKPGSNSAQPQALDK